MTASPVIIGRTRTRTRTRTRSRRPRVRRGNGVVEAMFVLPILIGLSMGMIEFGQFFYAKHSIQAASRDGARTAILTSATHAQAQAAVTNAMTVAGVSDATKYTVVFTNAATGVAITNVATTAKGTSIKVTVSSTAGNISLRPLGVIPASKAIVGVTSMIKE